MKLSVLRQRLETLAIFRDLLTDPVVLGVRNCLAQPTPEQYAAFVSALYLVNGGSLGAHLQTLCTEAETACTHIAARGEALPPHLRRALNTELETLQALADLPPEALQSTLGWDIPLAGYVSGGVDLAAAVLDQLENIFRRGYGMFAAHGMFSVQGQGSHGALVPVLHPDPVQLTDLVDYERERAIVLENTRALLRGKPAANLLLTGDAGTGKSSTIKAVANALAPEGLRLVELRREQLPMLPWLLELLAENPLKFVLFIDDLSFLNDDESFNALKAALEGSLSARSANVVIYATSNRRHLVKERFSDREGDEVHCSDTLQELKSLSDRFGLHVSFSKPDKATYLHIVQQLAREQGLCIDPQTLNAEAERAALERGGRSARLARQVVDALCSKESGV